MILRRRALLDEQAFKQVRRADSPPMRYGEAQVRNAGFEVVYEACDCTVLIPAVIGHDAGCKLACNRAARLLVGRLHAHLEVRPDILRHLGCQIAHPMRQAALAGSARKAHLDRLDDTGRAVRGRQQREPLAYAPAES